MLLNKCIILNTNLIIFLFFLFAADLNNVRFSAYRTAMKLRRLQKALCCKCWIYCLWLLSHNCLSSSHCFFPLMNWLASVLTAREKKLWLLCLINKIPRAMQQLVNDLLDSWLYFGSVIEVGVNICVLNFVLHLNNQITLYQFNAPHCFVSVPGEMHSKALQLDLFLFWDTSFYYGFLQVHKEAWEKNQILQNVETQHLLM